MDERKPISPNPDVEWHTQDRQSLLNFDFDGKAIVTFDDEEGFLHTFQRRDSKYSRLIHLLNQNSLTISDEITSELKARLRAVDPDVSVEIEFQSGSLIFTGIIALTDFLSRLDGTVNGIKIIIDAAKFAINKVIRRQIEVSEQVTVKQIETNVIERKIKERDPIKLATRFQWWCAGAVTDILRHCPEDKAKYQTIGAAVLTTGFLAFCSGGYALYTMFAGGADAAELGILFGLVWGLVIFNIDRSIVSSMRKDDDDKKSSFQKLRAEIAPAIPRILLAFVLGLIICKPLELRFFQNQILNKFEQNRQTLTDNHVNQLKEGKYKTRIEETERQLKYLEREIEGAKKQVERTTDTFNEEMDRRGGTRVYGYGPVAKKKEKDKIAAESRLGLLGLGLEVEKQNAASKAKPINDEIAKEREEYEKKITDDFSQRLQALWDLVDSSPGMKWANWGIIVLLIVIELVPILVKLFSRSGPYDSRLGQREIVARKKAHLGKESEVNVAEIKANSAIREAQKQSEILEAELESRKRAAVQVADHRYTRIASSEIDMIDTFFDAADKARKGRIKDQVDRWERDGKKEDSQPFDDFHRNKRKNIDIDLEQ